jgi:hypothetical protein
VVDAKTETKRTLDWDTVWECVRDELVGLPAEEVMEAVERAVEANLALQNRR